MTAQHVLAIVTDPADTVLSRSTLDVDNDSEVVGLVWPESPG